jgi:hypothetical protein
MYNDLIIRQIQQKSTKEEEGICVFQWLWMKCMVISTDLQLKAELVRAEYDLY